MLASMSATEWSDVDMAELLPTGTVTLLLADVEGSTQLWEAQAADDDGRGGASEPHSQRGHC